MQPSQFRIFRTALGLTALLLTLAWLGSAAFAADFVSTQPAARVEHWQRREAEINAYIRDSKDLKSVKLLFVGDSITDFWLFDDNPWVSGQKYGRPVWDESFGKPNSENFGFNIGISGDRIEHVLYRIQPRARGGLGQLDSPDLNPEFIVALIGINNTWAAEKPVTDSVFEGVRAVLTALHERKPKARIILQTLLPTNDEAKNRDVVRPVNQRLRRAHPRQRLAIRHVSVALVARFGRPARTRGDRRKNRRRKALLPRLSRALTAGSRRTPRQRIHRTRGKGNPPGIFHRAQPTNQSRDGRVGRMTN